MSRLPLSAGALSLIVMLALGVSAGPASADDLDPAAPSTTTETTVPPPVETVVPTPTESPPTETTTEPPLAELPPEPISTDPIEPTEPTTEPVPTEPAEPEVPPAATELPDLRLTVAFEKDSYLADERVVARVTIVNAGTATATDVTLNSTGNIDSHYWPGFGGWEHRTLEPGQTIESENASRVTSIDDGVVRLVVTVASAGSDADPTDNQVTVSVPVTAIRGSYSGLVYGDRNGSATMDPGEGLAGVAVEVSGGWPYRFYTTETDATGRFVFRDLPRGDYTVLLNSAGWVFPRLMITVDGVDDPDVVIRGSYPVNELVSASSAFVRPTYAPGGTAHLTLTFTNAEPAIPDLTAMCTMREPTYYGRVIWQLGQDGGVTMPARTTWTFDISLPLDGELVGYIEVGCQIGTVMNPDRTVDTVAATRVPGARLAQFQGRLLQLPATSEDRCGCGGGRVPVPDVAVYLRDMVTARVVARAVTDRWGNFVFYDVPVDRHHFGIVGPWTGTTLVVRSQDIYPPHYVYTRPGPDQPDPDLVVPPVGTPPAQGGRVPVALPELADTGSDVRWLAVGGLLTLALGIGVTVGTRRLT